MSFANKFLSIKKEIILLTTFATKKENEIMEEIGQILILDFDPNIKKLTVLNSHEMLPIYDLKIYNETMIIVSTLSK
ncbi:MAG: hypothetical protein MHPSP_001000, partial [Paramarteilia canceri]